MSHPAEPSPPANPQVAADPLASVHAHDARVTLQDLQTEITKARGELDRVQAQIAKAQAAWEEQLAGLRAERQRLLDDEPDDEDEPEEPPPHSDAHDAPAVPRHHVVKRGRGRR